MISIWKNNPALVQLLGLCPLLAVTTTFMNGLGLGLATLFVLLCSNGLIASIARWVPDYLRLPIFVLIIASFVTLVQMLMAAYFLSLYESLGIFLALITTNCIILGRAEAFASKNPVLDSLFDAICQGSGFLMVLLIIGGLRELIAHGFLLALMPPGAFILLGCLIAIKNILNEISYDTEKS